MAQPRQRRPEPELRAASEHVIYEIEMLHYTPRDLDALHRRKFDEDDLSMATHNALLEAWTIHMRSLIDFLQGSHRRRDDIVAEDFFDGARWQSLMPTIGKSLREADRRVDKEVAHLTYVRTEVGPSAKEYDIRPLTMQLAVAFRAFVESVPGSRVIPEFRARVDNPECSTVPLPIATLPSQFVTGATGAAG
jgi:hypothetical protein